MGVYAAGSGGWFVRYTNDGGPATLVFTNGPGGAGFVALTGTWSGLGFDGPGLYDPTTGNFFLTYQLAPGR